MKVDISSGRLVALSLLVAGVACSDAATDVSPPALAKQVAIVANSAAFSDTAWDTFVAQVTLRTSRIDSVGGAVSRESVPLTYVIERHRHGDDWDTQLQIPHQSWMPNDGGAAS